MSNSLQYQPTDRVMTHQMMNLPPRDRGEDAELSSYLNVIYAHRWLVFMVTLAVLLIGIAYAMIARPVYEANVLIHVEEENPNKEIRNLLVESGSMFSMKTSASAEIELLQSRLVISSAIDRLNLDVGVEPDYLPGIGRWLSNYSGYIPAPEWLRERGFAWGDAQIGIGLFSVPDEFLNRGFELTLENNGRFHIFEPKSGIVFTGLVGELRSFMLPSGPGRIEILVKNVKAAPGTRFIVRRSSRQLLIDDILMRMQVSEQGKQSGIIRASLKGDDAQAVNDLLSEIAKAYIRQNATRKTQEADNALAFLEKQLPEMKSQLDASESRYAKFRNENSMVDLGEDARISLQQSAAMKTRKMELDQKRNELLTRFTAEHPFVQGVDTQLADVRTEMRKLAGHIKGLPLLEQELVRLARDVKVNTELYTALLNTSRQLRLTTVAKTSNVRLVDMPLKPEKPVSPNRVRIVIVSLMAGLIMGVLSAFIRKSLKKSIDDPADIEQTLGMPVYAAIPHSKAQAELLAQAEPNSVQTPLLACSAPTDVAIESLRTFRTVLQYNLTGLNGKIVLITGPTPGTGKSFVSANLAALLGSGGKRVLLIDGDLRNGQLHSYFGMGRQAGLSEAIAGDKRLENVIHKEVQPNVDFITTGALPENCSELLMRPALAALLAVLEPRYDVILIDSAPVLAVSDPIILGMHATAIYLLIRAGMTTPADMAESLKRLTQAGLSANGFLFNGVPLRGRQYSYGYNYGHQFKVNYSRKDAPVVRV
jgi:tyrosine-protein kinase Etk/Wzc